VAEPQKFFRKKTESIFNASGGTADFSNIHALFLLCAKIVSAKVLSKRMILFFKL